MDPEIFDYDYRTDPHSLLKGFLNATAIYNFVHCMENLINKVGLGIAEAYYLGFEYDPDWEEDSPFEGIRIFRQVMNETPEREVHSFEAAFPLVKEAIRIYSERNPSKKQELETLTEKLHKSWFPLT